MRFYHLGTLPLPSGSSFKVPNQIQEMVFDRHDRMKDIFDDVLSLRLKVRTGGDFETL